MTTLLTDPTVGTVVTLAPRSANGGWAKVGGRIIIPVTWTDDPNLSLEALGVLTWLIAHSGPHTVSELADRFGYHPDTMARALSELETHSTVQYVDIQDGDA